MTTQHAAPRTVGEVITQPSEEHVTDNFDMPIPPVSTGLAITSTAYSTPKPPPNSEPTRTLVIVSLVAVVTFLLTRRAVNRSDNAPSGRFALGLSIVALISVLAFFLGIFSVALAGAAMMIAIEARRRVSSPTAATAAVVISA